MSKIDEALEMVRMQLSFAQMDSGEESPPGVTRVNVSWLQQIQGALEGAKARLGEGGTLTINPGRDCIGEWDLDIDVGVIAGVGRAVDGEPYVARRYSGQDCASFHATMRGRVDPFGVLRVRLSEGRFARLEGIEVEADYCDDGDATDLRVTADEWAYVSEI